ncbi:S1-like domain-containing RNA-binding protein [Bacillus sp. FJAT-49736]|uniref:CvfB family protein n=1 Tax=Bacillus sp. FJAT-49736 TaxID=2833582 RepID=UPI001BC9962B|nr:S1-like domain-containing RNA-binding protein [Bacillus sp. FJAT-49736]MBS4174474.1 hypothetical protein [Bacillus sp. FJAT-49736]
MTSLQPGTIVELQVEREAPFGYFLSNGEEDVLLHQSEILESFDPEEPQTVFIYQDHQGRLAATMSIPKIKIGTYDWVEVVEVKHELGVFVSIGISKDILVSKDDLPALFTLWPAKGDQLYCTLKTDKHNRLFGRLATEDIMRAVAVPATRKDFNKNVSGRAYRLLMIGTFILTDENYIGFIHESQRMQEPRLGQKVEGRIIDVKQDGGINVSLLKRGHEAMEENSDIIYRYMESRGGRMPYWDKSTPEDIAARFNMSKASFKRGLGKLMKEGKVYQEDGWSYFK